MLVNNKIEIFFNDEIDFNFLEKLEGTISLNLEFKN